MSAEDERQQRVIARARDLLPTDERVLAVYLIGSYGTGQADRFSDVDVHLVVTDDSADWFTAHWDDVLRKLTGPTVLADAVPGLIGGLGITADWLHVDLIAHPLASFDRFQYDGVRVLFDRDGTLFPDGDIPPAGGRSGEPYWPTRTVNLFYYFIGNLVTVLGRDERIVANQGVGAVRDQLIDLMLAERGVRRTSGAKRLNALLSPEQRTTLEAIPPVDATPATIIAANRYISHQFLTRATTLAKLTNTPWPTPFVEATLTHLQTHFSTDFR
ncbi:nucleotidyltransferase domain-containing protein [Kribbella sp. NPDC026611]|uniref:aminoglycoside 6-adenylyltransferase n=1 Tax=Kribbella sp. NPDC026611 TaxID=3154911 RepID=UPI0034072C38